MHRALALLMIAPLGACLTADDTQTISGRVERAGFDGLALGARVVQGDQVVVTAPLDPDGAFSVTVPTGTGYRLEIITSTGAHPFVLQAGGELVEHTFDVCDPGDPYDLGDVYQGDEVPEEWNEEPGWCPDGTMPDEDGTCDVPDDEPGCGDPPPPDWCPSDVPMEECWDPCLWDPMACEDPCVLYPETCDPCAKDPSRCEDPCLENPEWCDEPCESTDPTGMCDPCAEHPELCDPCLDDPSLCDPCATRPELCEEPCVSDPMLCEDPCALYPELCDPCVEDPSLCDPCLEHPELCEDPCMADPGSCDWGCTPNEDGSYDEMDPTCWPPPDEPCDENGVCDPDDCAVPEEPIPDFGCE